MSEVEPCKFQPLQPAVPTFIEMGNDSIVALSEDVKEAQDYPAVIFINGNGKTDWSERVEGRIIDIGREPRTNQVVRPDTSVSRQHISLVYGRLEKQSDSDQSFYVWRNPDSTNEVFIEELALIDSMAKEIPAHSWKYGYVTETEGPVFTIGYTSFHFQKEQGRLVLYSTYSKEGNEYSSYYVLNPREVISIGRDPSCNFILEHDTKASRVHATLAVYADTIMLRDNGSTNGTFAYMKGKEIREWEPLEAYIQNGLELIKQGSARIAEEHFLAYENARRLGIGLGAGENVTVRQLRTERDFIEIINTIAHHTKPHGQRSLEIATYSDGNGAKPQFEKSPKRYNPEFVKKFYYEISLLYAEEWVHILQDRKGTPLAGQSNDEVDVAAYFEQQGMILSPVYITRYPERVTWYIQTHPEREKEIRQFIRKYTIV